MASDRCVVPRQRDAPTKQRGSSATMTPCWDLKPQKTHGDDDDYEDSCCILTRPAIPRRRRRWCANGKDRKEVRDNSERGCETHYRAGSRRLCRCKQLPVPDPSAAERRL